MAWHAGLYLQEHKETGGRRDQDRRSGIIVESPRLNVCFQPVAHTKEDRGLRGNRICGAPVIPNPVLNSPQVWQLPMGMKACRSCPEGAVVPSADSRSQGVKERIVIAINQTPLILANSGLWPESLTCKNSVSSLSPSRLSCPRESFHPETL